jgi:hypothetical protein
VPVIDGRKGHRRATSLGSNSSARHYVNTAIDGYRRGRQAFVAADRHGDGRPPCPKDQLFDDKLKPR